MLELILVTFPDIESAKELSKKLVEQKLCACANIIPAISSIYVWNGKLSDENEVLVILKSSKAKRTELEAAIYADHPYDTPEFIALDSSYVGAKYLSWVKGGLK